MIKSRATCRPKSRLQSDLSTVSVLANRSLHQDLMHSGCRGTAVPNVCLQAFSLFPLPSSPLEPKACPQAKHLRVGQSEVNGTMRANALCTHCHIINLSPGMIFTIQMNVNSIIAELSCARSSSMGKKFGKLSIRENLVMT